MKTENHPEIMDKLWNAIMSYAERKRLIPIKGKVMRADFGEWKLFVNGTVSEVDCDGLKVAPYNAAIFYGDLPWAYFSAAEGIVGAGSGRPLEAVDHFLEAIGGA